MKRILFVLMILTLGSNAGVAAQRAGIPERSHRFDAARIPAAPPALGIDPGKWIGPTLGGVGGAVGGFLVGVGVGSMLANASDCYDTYCASYMGFMGILGASFGIPFGVYMGSRRTANLQTAMALSVPIGVVGALVGARGGGLGLGLMLIATPIAELGVSLTTVP